MNWKELVGQDVIVKFHDHVKQEKGVKERGSIECWVHGRIVDNGKRDITVEYWTVCDPCPETRKDNRETISIVKGTIFEIEVLKSIKVIKIL